MLVALLALVSFSAQAELADIIALYPANNHADLARANEALASNIEGHVPALCAMLTPTGDHSDLKARYALSALTMYLSKDGAPDDYVHALGKALQSSTQAAEVRAVFVRELSLCGNEAAIRYLVPLIGDQDLGHPAIQALESIGTRAAGDALASALAKLSGRQEAAAISALGNMQYGHAPFAIASRLGSEDADMREAAYFALANSASEAAYGPLMAMARKVDSVDRGIALEYLLTYANRIEDAGRERNAERIRAYVAAVRRGVAP